MEVCRRKVWRWRCVEGRYGGGGVWKEGMEVEVCRREVWRWRCVEGRYGGGGV